MTTLKVPRSATKAPAQTVDQRKMNKGWSKAAKGTMTGTASGALAGLLINKHNRAVGGVIGGLPGVASVILLGMIWTRKIGGTDDPE